MYSLSIQKHYCRDSHIAKISDLHKLTSQVPWHQCHQIAYPRRLQSSFNGQLTTFFEDMTQNENVHVDSFFALFGLNKYIHSLIRKKHCSTLRVSPIAQNRKQKL